MKNVLLVVLGLSLFGFRCGADRVVSVEEPAAKRVRRPKKQAKRTKGDNCEDMTVSIARGLCDMRMFSEAYRESNGGLTPSQEADYQAALAWVEQVKRIYLPGSTINIPLPPP